MANETTNSLLLNSLPGSPSNLKKVFTKFSANKQGKNVENNQRKLISQQTAIAQISQFALTGTSISELLDKTTTIVAQTLKEKYSSIFEMNTRGKELSLKAGVGWKKGLVGKVILGNKIKTYINYVLNASEPVVVENFNKENRFTTNLLLTAHKILGGISVVIPGNNHPFGILSIFTNRRRKFSEEDIDFLESTASVLAISIERKSGEKLQSFLSHASNILSTSLDHEVTLTALARLSVPAIADWCFVYMLDGKTVTRVTVEHANSNNRALAQKLGNRVIELNNEEPVSQVLRTGIPILVSEITNSYLKSIAQGGKHLKWLKDVGIKSVIIVPLAARGRTIGAITFLTAESGRKYDSCYLEIVNDLARRAALAIDNGRLYKEAQQEIVERKRIEEDLNFQKTLLESQSEASPDGILVVSPNRRILSYNQKLVKMWKIPETVLAAGSSTLAAELVSKNVQNPQEFLDRLNYLYNHPNEESRDEIIFKDGKIYDRYSTPIKDLDGTCYGRVWFYKDVTKSKNLEKQKDDFMAMASHELKTPVTTIKAFTQILQKSVLTCECPKSEPIRQYFIKIDTQVNKLTNLISDLLDVSRIESGKLSLHEEQFDLNKLTKEISEDLEKTTNKHKIIKKGKGQILVSADKDRIEQVITNLILNAIKYSPNSSKIVVSVYLRGKDAIVCVKDFGIGISKKYHKQIFGRFFQGIGSKKETYPGLGLGLYISSEIINRHKGNIWVESKKGKGSTFFFTLPLKI